MIGNSLLFRLARTVEGDRLANERLERGLVNLFSFVDVDRAAYVSVEARVEETGRIFQRRALGEGKLHDPLIGFAGADNAVVRPNRGAGFGWFDPLPLLDDVRVCFLEEFAHSAEGFSAPVPEFGDSFRDELRCRLALARARLFHVLILEVPDIFHARQWRIVMQTMIPRQTYTRAFIFSSSHTPRTRSRHAFRAASRKPASRAGRAKLRRATLAIEAPSWPTVLSVSESPCPARLGVWPPGRALLGWQVGAARTDGVD